MIPEETPRNTKDTQMTQIIPYELNGIPRAPLDVYDCYIGATVLYGNVTFIVKKNKRPLGNKVTIGLLLKNLSFLCLILIDSSL